MTTETIDNPTWDDVREGDLVTIEYGAPEQEDYVQRVNRVEKMGYRLWLRHLFAVHTAKDNCYRVTKIVREVPDPVTDHAKALVFVDSGMGLSDGDVLNGRPWLVEPDDQWYKTSELPNPVEALPVPAKELRELFEIARFADGPHDADNFLNATRREWDRAGIDGGVEQ